MKGFPTMGGFSIPTSPTRRTRCGTGLATVMAKVWGKHQPHSLIPPSSQGYKGGEKANLALPPDQTGTCHPFPPGTGPRDNPHLSEEPPADPPTSDNLRQTQGYGERQRAGTTAGEGGRSCMALSPRF